ncbi:helix-hairpin-helix domain-containing protein [Kocuria oceani]|uniref:helix-hairpin-helix domain-containing protein n=1 Tax=Kocuria oceani TaxID=988827 RepID=UPI004035273E
MTGTVSRGRDRAPSALPDPISSGHPGLPSLPAERLAALLAETGAGARPAPGPGPDDGAATRADPDAGAGTDGGRGTGAGGAVGAGGDMSEPRRRGADATARPDTAHRWETAARTRVPRSLLVLAAAAVAGLGWAVLGPGAPGEDAGAGGELALAEIGVSGDPTPSTGSPAPVAGGAPGGRAGPAASTAPGSDGSLRVHVAGEVARPGVVELAPGARVMDAVEAAGGLTDAAADSVNLAAPLTDGQQVLVPDEGAVPPAVTPAQPPAPAAGATGAAAAGGSGASAPGGTLNLNTATAAELEALPRVGPVLAGRIVEFRDQHGGFAATTDLDAVPGIGPTLLEALLPLVTV